MPELPEVETIVRDLKPFQGKTFAKVQVNDAFVLRQSLDGFKKALLNQTIKSIYRRGKAIIVHLSSGKSLIVHLMMTGQLVMNHQADKHTRIEFKFSDGSVLLYNDQRRFGQLRVVAELAEVKYFNILGPEPFSDEFTTAVIQEACKGSKRPIKNLLLDHTVIAGIGNIYACEILFRSKISPIRLASSITKKQADLLYQQIIEVLDEAIKHRGSSMRNYRDGAGQKGRFNQRISVYAKQGEPCPVCSKSLLRIIQAGRSTFYCKQCQK